MFSIDDTIVAVATPPGRGGIAVVRLSGPQAPAIAGALAGREAPWPPRVATRVRLSGVRVADDALVIWFQAPASYTGEDVVEISIHGSPVVTAAVVAAATARGARLARAGEFTLRAYLHGRIDLLQAEAVQELVDAVSPAEARIASGQLEGALSRVVSETASELRHLQLQLEASIDFPEEGYHFVDVPGATATLQQLRGRLQALVDGGARARQLRDGAQVVVAGAPNVGKSSVFNAIVGGERAIVTPIAGTTRDLVTEHVLLGDVHVRLVDTAGVRSSGDIVEQEGIRRATAVVAEADLVIVVVDRSRALGVDDEMVLESTADRPRLVVANKSDLPAAWRALPRVQSMATVSALRGDGLADLIEAVRRRVDVAGEREDVLVTNERHLGHLRSALNHIENALMALNEGVTSEEFLVADVTRALVALDDLTGARVTDDMLAEIFARFCIGK